ncbi:MAG TPA: DUF2335 domain-containing protein [Rectinemataceae bacterium]|nr:DUF2335 domain-containing protein [Rectinemataceae bacterium]
MRQRQAKRRRTLDRDDASAPQNINALVNSYSINNSILPRPEDLERIEALSPGATTKIVGLLEEQTHHRQELEKFVIAGDSRRADKGQTYAFILGMVGLLGGFTLIALGKEGLGIAAVITAIGTLLTAFFGGNALRKGERQKKQNRVVNKKL